MKVSEFKTTAMSIPVEPPRASAVNFAKVNPVVLEFTTADGLSAHGIAHAYNDRDVAILKGCVDSLAELMIGQDVFRFAQAWQKLWQSTLRMGRQGYGIGALSAVDMALWNLRAKAMDMPLSKLLGGYREEVPAYASHSLWRDWPIDRLQRDASSLVEQGFRAMKLRMGDKPLAIEIERLKAVREAVGPETKLMVDVRGDWTVTDSIRMGRKMEQYDLYWLEDPIPIHDLDGLAEIARALDVSVVVGEDVNTRYGFHRLLEKKATDIVMIDVAMVGGITEWMRVATLADARNLQVVSHLYTEFSCHLVAAVPNGLTVEYLPFWHQLYTEQPTVADGMMRIPDKPGIGYELDHQVMERYRV